MKIPKTIKVGGHTYTVSFSATHEDLQERHWGRTNLKKKTIVIEKTLPKSQQEETFIHELLHCVTHETKLNYDFDEKKEEDIVNRMAASLYQTLKDNNLLK